MDIERIVLNLNGAHSAGSQGRPGKLGRGILDKGIVQVTAEQVLPWADAGIQRICWWNPFGQWHHDMHFDAYLWAKEYGPAGAWDGWRHALEMTRDTFDEVIMYLGEFTHFEGVDNARAHSDGSTYLPDRGGDHKQRLAYPRLAPTPWGVYLPWAVSCCGPVLDVGAINFATGTGSGTPEFSLRHRFLQHVAGLKGRVYYEPIPRIEHSHMNHEDWCTISRERFVQNWEGKNWDGRVRPEDLVAERHILMFDTLDDDQTPTNEQADEITRRQDEGWVCHVRDNHLRNLI